MLKPAESDDIEVIAGEAILNVALPQDTEGA